MIFFIRGAAWEDAFLDAVGEADENGYFKHLSVSRFSSRTLDHELEKNTRTVVPYFSTTFIIMGLFSVATCAMSDWVRSKPWLGLFGNLSAAMATAAAFGACSYIGVQFIGINLAAPFLMIGKFNNFTLTQTASSCDHELGILLFFATIPMVII